MLTPRPGRAKNAAMNLSRQLAPPDKKLTYGGGEFHVCYPRPRVLLLTAHGYGEAGLAQAVCAEMDAAARAACAPVEVFTDDRKLTGCEPAYRAAFEQWLGDCWRSVSAVHLLIESSAVQLDVEVMSLKLDEGASYHMYKNFADWNKKYKEALDRADATSPAPL